MSTRTVRPSLPYAIVAAVEVTRIAPAPRMTLTEARKRLGDCKRIVKRMASPAGGGTLRT